MNNILKGIGKDAELETNANGGSQSKAIGAMHLVDPDFLLTFANGDMFITNIAFYLKENRKKFLLEAINSIGIKFMIKPYDILFIISKVLKEGAEEYGVNNWRLIPQEEHLNHAMIHYLAYLVNDKQDDHIAHCLTRIMFAYATETSEGFYYTKHKSQIPDMSKCKA